MRTKPLYILTLMAVLSANIYAQRPQRNQMEFGLQGGMGFYVGDAQPHIFQDIMEAYGAELTYMFNYRWALQLQGVGQRIKGLPADANGLPIKGGTKWVEQLVNFDITARFNFLPYGTYSKYTSRTIKPYTPYIYTGIGMVISGGFKEYNAYIPVGLGFRWRCSEHIGMYLAWQWNIVLGDNLEKDERYNNIHKLNGSNILNCDLTSTIQFGMIFEFAKEKRVCQFCD